MITEHIIPVTRARRAETKCIIRNLCLYFRCLLLLLSTVGLEFQSAYQRQYRCKLSVCQYLQSPSYL
ncbi:hypothetical protein A0H81_07008 [Grifola frondosa]|uniref:Uncharacterized protein n=1 Tax=Grifola frondosa TaxID=5627 RepID=A0A1C7M8E9_GRIFR|nr:hypothetical protein A0H81_07008 [Grifola frondosa]